MRLVEKEKALSSFDFRRVLASVLKLILNRTVGLFLFLARFARKPLQVEARSQIFEAMLAGRLGAQVGHGGKFLVGRCANSRSLRCLL